MSSNRPDVEEQYEDEWREEQTLLGKRPWGNFIILYEDQYCKVKKITVKPNQRLSMQSHEKRDEFWSIISGSGVATINDKDYQFCSLFLYSIPTYKQVFIARKIKHRIANPSQYEDLVFLEVQTGEYFGEDDIVRYEDDYGRTNEK